MPNNTDTQNELIMRQIFNSYNSLNTFNNIINTINQQDLVIHDLISNIRPAFTRQRRNNINNPWQYSMMDNITTNNYQNQIRTLEERLAQLETYIESDTRNRPVQENTQRFTHRSTRNLWNTWRRMAGTTMTNVEFPTLQPVIIRPSLEQISRAVENIVFSEITNPLNVRCPISLTQFQPNQNVTRIRQCQHIFDTSNIHQWFQTNVRCPVCRYDIRDYNIENNSTSNNSTSNNTENTENTETTENTENNNENSLHSRTREDIANIIGNDIMNQLNRHTDSSGNLTVEYSFITPIPINENIQEHSVNSMNINLIDNSNNLSPINERE